MHFGWAKAMTASAPNTGTVVAVRGSVVDAEFRQRIPAIHHVLKTGVNGEVVVEVASHLDAATVRGIALTPTRGLSRGTSVVDTQQQLRVPVGEQVLGRVFNVFGEVIDGKEPLTGIEWRLIHQASVPLMRRATNSEIFATGIK